MSIPSIVEALQLAVSPVILLSAYGLLLLSMSNRLGRVIDRARQYSAQPTINKGVQVHILVKRAKWIRSAILFTSIAILETAVLVLALFISVLFQADVQHLIAALFVASLVCLIIATIFFIADIFGALKAMQSEVAEHDFP